MAMLKLCIGSTWMTLRCIHKVVQHGAVSNCGQSLMSVTETLQYSFKKHNIISAVSVIIKMGKFVPHLHSWKPKCFQLQGEGLCPLTLSPGALRLDPAGGSAPDPRYRLALAVIPPLLWGSSCQCLVYRVRLKIYPFPIQKSHYFQNNLIFLMNFSEAISAANFSISALVLHKQHNFKHKRQFSQVLMQARRRLQKLVIDFLTASCSSSSHIFSNALVLRCSLVVDSDICTSPASTPKHGSQADLNPGCLLATRPC